MELLLNTDRTILITGGAGFIGSHVVSHFVQTYPEYKIINLDNAVIAINNGYVILIDLLSQKSLIIPITSI